MLGFSKLPSLRTFGVAAFLVVVSLIALAWFYLGGAVRQYEITPSAFSYQFVSDATTGGKTTGNVTVTPDGVVMECDMSPAYVWPYCELAIRLSGDPARGLDVSQFNSLILDASYDSPPGNNGRVRVYLRNYHPAYSTPEDPVSMKFNGIEYSAAKEETRYEFPLDSFQVLTWWIADKKIAPQHAAVDLSNITLIEIATGSGSLPGKYRFELKRLIFEGEWISERELLHALVWLWLGSAVGWMVVHYRELRQQLADSRRQSRLLKKANKALHRESEELCGKVYTDALTGVRNRTDINGWLEKEISSASEKAIPFSLLCIDVDHFKHVNDAYGHPVGDEVLREFAQTIAQQLDPETSWFAGAGRSSLYSPEAGTWHRQRRWRKKSVSAFSGGYGAMASQLPAVSVWRCLPVNQQRCFWLGRITHCIGRNPAGGTGLKLPWMGTCDQPPGAGNISGSGVVTK